MAKRVDGNGNGNTLRKVLMWAAGGLIAMGAAGATINWNRTRIEKIEPRIEKMEPRIERIEKMEPEVRKNTEYRLKDETDTLWLKDKVQNIETMQKEILAEVRKR